MYTNEVLFRNSIHQPGLRTRSRGWYVDPDIIHPLDTNGINYMPSSIPYNAIEPKQGHHPTSSPSRIRALTSYLAYYTIPTCTLHHYHLHVSLPYPHKRNHRHERPRLPQLTGRSTIDELELSGLPQTHASRICPDGQYLTVRVLIR